MQPVQSTSSSHAPWWAFVFFAVIIGIIIFVYVRRREITFTGEVIDKDVVETTENNYAGPQNRGISINNYGGGVRHTYRIKVKTDAGKTLNYDISEGKYEIIKIGDRVSKAKGTTDVEIISSAASAGNVTPAAQPQPATPIQPTTQTPSFVPPQPAAPLSETPAAEHPPNPTPPQTPASGS